MFAKSLRNLIVFIFLFAVLEKTGCDLMFFIKGQSGFNKLTELFESEGESTSKESEKKGEQSLKEFWICTIYHDSVNSHLAALFKQQLVKGAALLPCFYPSVPTPPPNLLAV